MKKKQKVKVTIVKFQVPRKTFQNSYYLLLFYFILLFVDMWVNTVPFLIVSVCEYCVQKVVSFINSASTPFN